MKKERIIIVGGVAGGATAAARLRRVNEHAEILLFERGPYISFANCGLPYFIGGEIDDREKLLVTKPDVLSKKYNLHIFTEHDVLQINTQEKWICVVDKEGNRRNEAYDKLILSQGANPITPPFKGVEQDHVFSLRNIPDMDRIHDFINQKKPEHAVVIGGGFIGLEMAEAFFHRDMKVTIIEKAPHVLPMLEDDLAWEFSQKVKRDNFEILANIGATEIHSDYVLLENKEKVQADIVLLSVGVRPEQTLAKETGLEIGPSGGLKVNSRMETNIKDVYAVGDMAETFNAVTGHAARIPLAGPANRQAKTAATNAGGGYAVYRGSIGTSIVRLFDTVVATTGINSRQAKAANLRFFTSVTRDFNHVTYYPGATTVVTKLIVEEGSQRILGAQIIGTEGVDRRIDVFATAIMGKLTTEDLTAVDYAYSPPFGAPNDAVNMAAFVATNIAKGVIRTENPDDFNLQDEIILDVRENSELAACGKLENTLHIPLGELRNRLDEIPKGKKLVIACQKGQRGYIATRILQQHDFEVKNLQGGFLAAKACQFKVIKN